MPKIFLDLGGDRSGRGHHAIDDRIGEACERHRRRIDLVALGIPFRGQRLSQLARRRGQRPPRGRPHRPAVEQHREAFRPFADRHRPVEPRPELRAHVSPRGLARVERLVLENLLENVPHDLDLCGAAKRRKVKAATVLKISDFKDL